MIAFVRVETTLFIAYFTVSDDREAIAQLYFYIHPSHYLRRKDPPLLLILSLFFFTLTRSFSLSERSRLEASLLCQAEFVVCIMNVFLLVKEQKGFPAPFLRVPESPVQRLPCSSLSFTSRNL